MISIIIVLCPLILAIYLIAISIFLSKKGEPILHNVRSGNTCYGCKTDLYDDPYEFYYGDDVRPTLCKACNRDEKLNILTNIIPLNINSIKKFIYKYNNKLIIALCIAMITGFIIEFLIRYYFKIDTKLGTIINVIYLLITCYKTELSYRKKLYT